MGRTAHSWRASHARFRCFRADYLSLDETSAERCEASQVLARLLRNHREAIAAIDFFTAPTITFSMLYCFFVISHDRRRILHLNVTKHPTSQWVVQQLREAFPFATAPRLLIFDCGNLGSLLAITRVDVKPGGRFKQNTLPQMLDPPPVRRLHPDA